MFIEEPELKGLNELTRLDKFCLHSLTNQNYGGKNPLKYNKSKTSRNIAG